MEAWPAVIQQATYSNKRIGVTVINYLRYKFISNWVAGIVKIGQNLMPKHLGGRITIEGAELLNKVRLVVITMVEE